MNAADDPHRALKCLLLSMLVILATGCQAIEHRVVFNPHRYPHQWNVPSEAELSGLSLEDACFTSADGSRLHGWFVYPVGSAPENFILFAHGRTGNVSSLKNRLFEFVRLNQSAVFVFDYRGFGKSEGRPSETGLYQDMQAARVWLTQRTGLAPQEIVVMGHSLGAPLAIHLAACDGAKALIVESGFTSTQDVVRHHSRQLLHGCRLQTRFESLGKIGLYQGPVFISHGILDKAIPFSQGTELAAAARQASRVQFVACNGGHRSPRSESYKMQLCQFLKSL